MNLKIKRKLIIVEAPIWRRVTAFLLDYIIINSLILFPFNNLMQRILKTDNIFEIMSMMGSRSGNISGLVIISLFMGMISLLYFSIIEWKSFQSIGKIIMKIFVISTNKKINNKEMPKLTFIQSVLRSLPVLFFFIFPILAMVDIISLLFNKEKLRIMEKISNTKTVSAALI
jgi:uncharacterized RDD family membrane protein YckC